MTEAVMTAAVLAFCSIVQGMIGFGFSLFSVPLLLLLGGTLPQAVALSAVASTLQRSVMAHQLHRSVPWRRIGGVIALTLIGLPLGILLLRELGSATSSFVKRVVGSLVLATLACRWFVRVQPSERVHPVWGALAGLCAGVLQGLANVGGPPLVLWALAHRWSAERLRGVAPVIMLFLSPFQIVLLYRVFGAGVWPAWMHWIIYVPVVVAATVTGLQIGKRLPVARLRVAAYALLALLALALMLDPLSALR